MSIAAEYASLGWPPAQVQEPAAGRWREEAALVRRVQAGDEMAFREIVERFQAKVVSAIHRILGQNNDVEDVAQQVFTKVYMSIHTFECRSSLLAWIYRIAVNESYEYLRRKKVRPLVYQSDLKEEEALRMDGWEPAQTQCPRLDSALAQRDFVLKLLAVVSEEERYLLLMKEVEGYSVEELSELTGVKANSVKVKLFRARRKMLKAAARKGQDWKAA